MRNRIHSLLSYSTDSVFRLIGACVYDPNCVDNHNHKHLNRNRRTDSPSILCIDGHNLEQIETCAILTFELLFDLVDCFRLASRLYLRASITLLDSPFDDINICHDTVSFRGWFYAWHANVALFHFHAERLGECLAGASEAPQ